MVELNMEHVLILAVAVFLLYHFMNRFSNGVRSGNNFSVGGPCICKETRDGDPDHCYNSNGSKVPVTFCSKFDTNNYIYDNYIEGDNIPDSYREEKCEIASYCNWVEDIPDSWEPPKTVHNHYWPNLLVNRVAERAGADKPYSLACNAASGPGYKYVICDTYEDHELLYKHKYDYICKNNPFYKDDTCEAYLPDCSESCSGHTYPRGRVANVPDYVKNIGVKPEDPNFKTVCNANPCDAKTTPYASLYNFDICGNNRTDFIGKGPCCDTRKCQ